MRAPLSWVDAFPGKIPVTVIWGPPDFRRTTSPILIRPSWVIIDFDFGVSD